MISKESMQFLFKTLDFYENQYDKISSTCFDDVYNVLCEISKDFLPKSTEVLQFGSYRTKSNYQLIEPMELYVVLHANREQVRQKEYQQIQASKLKKKKKKSFSVKEIYQDILSGSSTQKESEIYTAFDVAKIIMEQMQKYLSDNDKVFYKDNIVFVKFYYNDEIEVLANINIVYDFENSQNYEFKKYGISTKENSLQMLENIQRKNEETNGNYLVLCKLIKMLELELVITDLSERFLSKKSLFVEHIIYNVPNDLLKEDDFSKMFINVVNYLKNSDMNNIMLADNTSKMFVDYGYYAKNTFVSFIKKIIYLNEHTDEMLKRALENANHNDNKDKSSENNIIVDTPKKIKKLGKNN